MVDVQHSELTGASLHEPKGVAAADANRAYISDGTGSGDWTTVGLDVLADTAKAFQAQLLHVRDEKAAGTDGGTFTSGAWRTRTLNTSKTNEITGASIVSNQITLPAGTYWLYAWADGNSVGDHKLKFYNVTDASDTLIGTNGRSGISSPSYVTGRFTIAAEKVFELRHQCQVTVNTTGFGEATDFGVVEVYAEVCIWKIA